MGGRAEVGSQESLGDMAPAMTMKEKGAAVGGWGGVGGLAVAFAGSRGTNFLVSNVTCEGIEAILVAPLDRPRPPAPEAVRFVHEEVSGKLGAQCLSERSFHVLGNEGVELLNPGHLFLGAVWVLMLVGKS